MKNWQVFRFPEISLFYPNNPPYERNSFAFASEFVHILLHNRKSTMQSPSLAFRTPGMIDNTGQSQSSRSNTTYVLQSSSQWYMDSFTVLDQRYTLLASCPSQWRFHKSPRGAEPPPQYHHSCNVRDIRCPDVVTVITSAEIFQLLLNWNINCRPFPLVTITLARLTVPVTRCTTIACQL